MPETRKIWYVEIERKQEFYSGGTRRFRCDVFVIAENPEEAMADVVARYFVSAERFADMYWEQNCPPPDRFSLTNKIVEWEEVKVPGYRIMFEKE